MQSLSTNTVNWYSGNKIFSGLLIHSDAGARPGTFMPQYDGPYRIKY